MGANGSVVLARQIIEGASSWPLRHDLARNHVSLEFARSFSEFEDLAVAVVALDGRFGHEPSGSVVVKRALDDPRAGFGRE